MDAQVRDSSTRLLELNFVDVGQGDGCFIVTPDDERLLIDAGEGDNMMRFLFWRFNLARHPNWKINFKAGIVSHPDSDHHYGFSHLLKSGNFHPVKARPIRWKTGREADGRLELVC